MRSLRIQESLLRIQVPLLKLVDIADRFDRRVEMLVEGNIELSHSEAMFQTTFR